DEYLMQAVFATRICQHTVTKHSLFYLLYELHLCILKNASEQMRENVVIEDLSDHLKEVEHARSKVNELLLN
ncbi:hypothetical protein EMCG_03287, partial [[Emmonsia] crescens]